MKIKTKTRAGRDCGGPPVNPGGGGRGTILIP
jgi:hypothetical protein